MGMHCNRRWFAIGVVVSLLSAPSSGQTFPTKALTLVVPAAPGGLIDASARLVGVPLAKLIGQPVIVDNRSGGSGNVGYSQVAHAAADGHTLLVSYSGYHVGNPALTDKLPWSQKDLIPVAMITAATNVIVVHPSLPVSTVKELIDYLKANPGKVTYASQGNGSLSHIGTEMFKLQTGTSMVHIPYRGSGPAIQDVLSGQVQLFMTTPPSVMGHVRSGKLRALAITGKNRHPALPGVSTAEEAGLNGLELEAWVAIFAPAGTPPNVVATLSATIKRALDLPESKSRADDAGVALSYRPAEALSQLVKRDTEYWAKVVKAAGIKAD
jgi:tripartite-type tricarboxylate transporter receptor subunit TctC